MFPLTSSGEKGKEKKKKKKLAFAFFICYGIIYEFIHFEQVGLRIVLKSKSQALRHLTRLPKPVQTQESKHKQEPVYQHEFHFLENHVL